LKKIIKEIFFNNIGLTCNFAELIKNNSLGAAYSGRRPVDPALTYSIINPYEPGFQLNFALGKKPLSRGKLLRRGYFVGDNALVRRLIVGQQTG